MNKYNLKNHKSNNEMFDDIANILSYQDIDIETISDHCELYEALDYDGSVHGCIDGMIDVYYYDLRQWAVEKWEYIEEAQEEGLCDGVTDYHQIIQSGQYIYYRNLAGKAIEELYEGLKRKNDIKNLLCDMGADTPAMMAVALQDGEVLAQLECELGEIQEEIEDLYEELK